MRKMVVGVMQVDIKLNIVPELMGNQAQMWPLHSAEARCIVRGCVCVRACMCVALWR